MRTLSGIQPTGNLHLGNYLGAIRNWVRMQDEMEGDKLYFLADLHAITVHNDPAELTANTREMAAALIAAGGDPPPPIPFNPARGPAPAPLAWLLFCPPRTC
ncbi:MAG TPA: tryptophan--tRNA ligase, partial [Sphingopyxis sp.]|nr:tryptophan--tRNA ligase [Sphingopyxis sp.]